jgi:hypothetical protein
VMSMCILPVIQYMDHGSAMRRILGLGHGHLRMSGLRCEANVFLWALDPKDAIMRVKAGKSRHHDPRQVSEMSGPG